MMNHPGASLFSLADQLLTGWTGVAIALRIIAKGVGTEGGVDSPSA